MSYIGFQLISVTVMDRGGFVTQLGNGKALVKHERETIVTGSLIIKISIYTVYYSSYESSSKGVNSIVTDLSLSSGTSQSGRNKKNDS